MKVYSNPYPASYPRELPTAEVADKPRGTLEGALGTRDVEAEERLGFDENVEGDSEREEVSGCWIERVAEIGRKREH